MEQNKSAYLPPKAELVCFQPMERIATDDDSYESTAALFGNTGSGVTSVSFEVIDPGFSGWD